MKTSNPVILSLLSDERILALLNEQERAYWESSIGVPQNHGTSNSMSLPKITFLFTMFSFENPNEQDVVYLAYKLLKTFPIDDSNQRVEWNDLANLQLKDEYLSYYFLLASLALQLNKTISFFTNAIIFHVLILFVCVRARVSLSAHASQPARVTTGLHAQR